MTKPYKLALPDLVSNSYFPAIAAVELGLFRKHGLDVELEMVYPAPACYDALRDGQVDLVAGSAHLPLLAFPGWQGASLICALSQGMYWFLVLRDGVAQKVLPGLGHDRSNLEALGGLRIVAAPGVDLGFQQLLVAAGVDASAEDIQIIRLPGGVAKGVSFGVAAARAMIAGDIDGFWANGMAAAVAVDSGAGTIALDVRRGDGPAAGFGFTQPTLAARDDWINADLARAAAAKAAIDEAHSRLAKTPADVSQVGQSWFPEQEARLISGLVQRDLPYYSTSLSENFVESMQAFAIELGLTEQACAYADVVHMP